MLAGNMRNMLKYNESHIEMVFGNSDTDIFSVIYNNAMVCTTAAQTNCLIDLIRGDILAE